MKIPEPVEYFTKGEFKGLVFLKFVSVSDRDRAIGRIKEARLTLEGKSIWIREEASIKIRAMEKFILGLRKQLISWGYGTKEVKADIDGHDKVLKVNGVCILEASVTQDGKLALKWAADWEKTRKVQ